MRPREIFVNQNFDSRRVYNDFLVLLLKISFSREDLCKLATGSFDAQVQKEVLSRIEQTNMPSEMREYYIKNFDRFAKIYYPIQHRIQPGYDTYGPTEAQKVDYWSHDIYFNKLKSYADAGKIISTIGDIGDLHFLDGQKIAILDTSNVGDYSILNANTNSFPIIIWNAQFRKFHGSDRYRSYEHEPLTLEEKNKFDHLFEKILDQIQSNFEIKLPRPLAARVIMKSIMQNRTYGRELYQEKIKWTSSSFFCIGFVDPFHDPAPFSYSKTTLKALEILTSDDADSGHLQETLEKTLHREIQN